VTTVETPTSTVRAEARYVRAAPRKAQLVVDQIRGRTVPEARTILAFLTRDAARDVSRVLDSAVANAEANHGLVGDELIVAAAYVGAGPQLKRWRARARGRVGRIRKRTCHITVALALPTGEEIPAPIEHPKPAEPAPAEPVAEEETQADEAPAEEEKPKRTRASRKKPAADAAAATETEEQPKPRRTRAAKSKPAAEGEAAAGAEAAAEAEEKPKAPRKPRATREKKTEEEA
jgi:large subunit ribosomal protein L22